MTSGSENAEPALNVFRNSTIDANGTIHSEFHTWRFKSNTGIRAYTAGTEVSQ